jgi:hypothetical protein
MEEKPSSKFETGILVVILIAAGGFAWYAHGTTITHTSALANVSVPFNNVQTPAVAAPVVTNYSAVTHSKTPAQVNAIYVSSWSAGTASSMAHINSLLAGGKLDAVVIDIKDATGRISYQPLDPSLIASRVGTRRIANLPALIAQLHSKGIYVIGRVAVFQDPYYAAAHPEDALQNIVTGTNWKDAGGLQWLRADSPAVWHYVESIAEDGYNQGFDEINLDYVRFPSDGDLKDIDETGFTKNKADTIAAFFTDVDTILRQQDHIPLSADLFGLTMSSTGDMGIGQKLELIAPHVDYVCPMVYPSHFANGTYGVKDVANAPYTIVHTSLANGILKLKAIGLPARILRPWLQDFTLGAVYTPDMVQAQINATNDDGIMSWLFWDPRNIYTSSVLK